MVKHLMIGLLPQLLQQVKYEGIDTFKQVICIAKKKEASLEKTSLVPRTIMIKSSRKSLEGSFLSRILPRPTERISRMEIAMEQLVYEMTQLSVHLL